MIKQWGWVVACSVLLVSFLATSSMLAILALHVSQKNADLIANFNKSPFKSVSLDTIEIDNSATHAPNEHALFVPVCGQIKLRRSVIVDRDTVALVGRAINSQLFNEPLTAGLEHFSVRKNPNVMTPVIVAASNWPRYTYLAYSTFLQAADMTSGPYEMQNIFLFIVDANQPIPTPGSAPPKPPLNPGPQPSCPASTAASPPFSLP